MKITDFGVAVCESDSHLSKWVVEQRRLDVQAEYCRLFKGHIPVGGVVVDIGACIGDHTLSYAQMVGPAGRVHAFEPNPEAFQCLAYNMARYSNVTCYPVGLGDVSCKAKAVKSPDSPENLGATMVEKAENGNIQIVTLDSMAVFLERMDFVKIDAEGFEPEILAGAIHTLRRFRPVILVEINRKVLNARGKQASDIFGPLLKLGYSVRPSEPHHSFTFEQVDALCTISPGAS